MGRIALALLRAAVGMRQPVPLAELVLAAWRLDPAALGLRGHELEHPDVNKAVAALSHAGHAIRRRGLLVRAGAGRYEITPAGREAVQGAAGPKPGRRD